MANASVVSVVVAVSLFVNHTSFVVVTSGVAVVVVAAVADVAVVVAVVAVAVAVVFDYIMSSSDSFGRECHEDNQEIANDSS